jgi:NAD(P)-dependent dehydrogenase (short-subunit alcohol dehydrogenase family)
MPDPLRLDGRVTIVTGGAGGIGAAVCHRMAIRGAEVAVCDVDIEAATQIAASVREATDQQALACQLDVRSPGSCSSCVDSVVADFGRLDFLVNCAGITRRLDAASTSEEVWHELMEVNLHGVVRMCLASRSLLIEHPGGAVVNLGSTSGAVAVANSAAYGVTKAGVHQLTRALAYEWAEVGVRVNAVAPTIVETPMTADVRQNPSYMEAKLAAIPMHRVVQPEEVAEVVTWLCSPSAAMVTGQVVFVDGGFTIV